MVEQKKLVGLRMCLSCKKDIGSYPIDRVYCVDCFSRPGDDE
jgi:hypothetical protein